MIDWTAFFVVAAASLLGACAVVVLFALGVRNAARRPWLARTCWVLCGAAVLFGIYLIVPALHA